MTNGNPKKLTFRELIRDQKIWNNYGDYCTQIPGVIYEEIKKSAAIESKLIRQIRDDKRFKELDIRNAEKRLPEAEHLLAEGKVVGIDATMAKYHLDSGVRCQIGVVAANYIGDQIRHSFFISQNNIDEEIGDPFERLENITKPEEQLSDLHLRGLMYYREREAGLNEKFDNKLLMFHGPLLPFELMSGLGRLRALDYTIELLERIVSSKRCLSVISSPSFKEFLFLGKALENNQYMYGRNYTLANHLTNSTDFLRWSEKWREEERKKVENFVNDYASKISIGVIKLSERPYVFHAHRDIFDLAASVIARDSLFQREKGFPLLIDYADNMCSEYFSNSEFAKMVEWEIAKSGNYLKEIGERRMRLK